MAAIVPNKSIDQKADTGKFNRPRYMEISVDSVSAEPTPIRTNAVKLPRYTESKKANRRIPKIVVVDFSLTAMKITKKRKRKLVTAKFT